MKCRRHLSTDKQKTAAKSAVFLSSLVSYDLIDHEAVDDGKKSPAIMAGRYQL